MINIILRILAFMLGLGLVDASMYAMGEGEKKKTWKRLAFIGSAILAFLAFTK